MAKKPTITTVQSGFNSQETINANFQALADAFDNTVSRDGSTPNTLDADLDINGNVILGASAILVNGNDVVVLTQEALSAALVAQTNAENTAAIATSAASTATIKASAAAASAVASENSSVASEASRQAALTSENNSAASATSSATSAAASSSSAAQSAVSATAALNSQTAAATSATNSLNSANASATSASQAAASQAAAATSETNASASETAAATSASAASLSESNAATSETNAAASATASATSASQANTSANSASTSEVNAAASAAAALLSETNAATSESNAAASEAAAASSASSASASADAALAALDSFDDRYLGQKSADPTLDNDGNPLATGALYYNTVDEIMKVFDGSLWVAAYASLSGAMFGANNLSDVDNIAASRTNLGLGTAATTAATDYATAAQGALADTAVQPADIGTAAALDVGTGANNVIQLDGSAKLPAVDGSQLTGIVSIPQGLISLWSGSVATIPSGWALCDGLNGTPNLTDRFVVGAGGTYAVGATGGSDTVTLTEAQVPSHTHSFSANATTGGSGAHTPAGNLSNTGDHAHNGTTANSGNHTHNGSTSNTGAHTHNVTKYFAWGYQNVPGGASEYNGAVNNPTGSAGAHSHNFTTAGGGDHAHNFSTSTTGAHNHVFTGTAVGNHTHSVGVSGTTGATGSSTSHENRPPYYALAYIMKL